MPGGRQGSRQSDSGWRNEYEVIRPLYARLAEEVKFALEQELAAANVKTHDVVARSKTPESLADKAERKGYDQPLDQAEDLAGVRVVTLYLSDLPKVEQFVRRHIDVQSEEDTIEGGDASTFGYMSKHYVGTLVDRYSGARYDDLKGLKVEVQARTILMDAWANVSHHLAYKSDASIPRELRRQFSALSGLFYVADQQFEALVSASGVVQQQASAELETSGADASVELNLDTLAAYLRERYPDRERSDREGVAELADQISEAGYSTIGELEHALARSEPAFVLYDRDHDPHYTDVGVVRVSLSILDERFNKLAVRGSRERRAYRKHVKPSVQPED